jgi:glyoxylase I family protein
MGSDADEAIARPAGISHVRLTVTDIARSKAFYRRALGTDPAKDFSDQVDDPAARDDPRRLFGGCMFALGSQVLGLRPAAPTGDRFSSTRVGLDHISLQLGSIEELSAAADRLHEAGIVHGEVTELTEFGLAILSFQDPDDINLELTAPIQRR